MKVSQVTHCMERDAEVHIIDTSLPVDQMFLFTGPRRTLHKDNKLNHRHVRKLWPCDEAIVLDVAERKDNG